jgi:putative intracellular protease/amidase
MFDLSTSLVSHQIIREFYENGKIVSAVCHGSVALARARLSDGEYLISGQSVTGFSNGEEKHSGLWEAVPFHLETELRKNTGDTGSYERADEIWAPKVVRSGQGGRLLTGQNPASAKPLAEAILSALQSTLLN